MKTYDVKSIGTPLSIVNAAFVGIGVTPIKHFRDGSRKAELAYGLYHPIRRELLCKELPEFAVKIKEEERPTDMIRDLGDGRYVVDDELVWEWDNDFKYKLIVALMNKFSIFLRLFKENY